MDELPAGRRLIEEINREPAIQPVLWWLGQSGWAIKYHDMVFYVDPSFSPGGEGQDPLLQAGDVTNADLFLVTQSVDPALPDALAASPGARVLLPLSTAETARANGVNLARMMTIDADLRVDYGKAGAYVRIYAAPGPAGRIGGQSRLGYLIRCDHCTIFHGGACELYDGLALRLRPYSITVALLPTGGQAGIVDAAALAAGCGARWLVPMVHGPDPNLFIAHMLFHRPAQRFKVFRPGERWMPPED